MFFKYELETCSYLGESRISLRFIFTTDELAVITFSTHYLTQKELNSLISELNFFNYTLMQCREKLIFYTSIVLANSIEISYNAKSKIFTFENASSENSMDTVFKFREVEDNGFTKLMTELPQNLEMAMKENFLTW